VAGAAVVALIWLTAGGGGTASALEQDPGIPPPDYVYLNNARVVLYLGQIEGGLSASETLTNQRTQNRNATVAASGFQLGGSSGLSSSVERVVTPTATARFYRLLDRLQTHGYLRTIDANTGKKALARTFAALPEGAFVRLRNCRLRIPAMSNSDSCCGHRAAAWRRSTPFWMRERPGRYVRSRRSGLPGPTPVGPRAWSTCPWSGSPPGSGADWLQPHPGSRRRRDRTHAYRCHAPGR
jgi:hypothetical protein